MRRFLVILTIVVSVVFFALTGYNKSHQTIVGPKKPAPATVVVNKSADSAQVYLSFRPEEARVEMVRDIKNHRSLLAKKAITNNKVDLSITNGTFGNVPCEVTVNTDKNTTIVVYLKGKANGKATGRLTLTWNVDEVINRNLDIRFDRQGQATLTISVNLATKSYSPCESRGWPR